MALFAVVALLSANPMLEIDDPLPAWISQKMEGQCGLIQGSIEFKNVRNAKRPEVLKGHVAYGNQKRSLAIELDGISREIERIGEVGISCQGEDVLVLQIRGQGAEGLMVYRLFVNNRLEVTVHKS